MFEQLFRAQEEIKKKIKDLAKQEAELQAKIDKIAAQNKVEKGEGLMSRREALETEDREGIHEEEQEREEERRRQQEEEEAKSG